MKLHLGVGINPQSGFVNVDPSSAEGGKVVADFRDINHIVEDAEATEILAPAVLDYIRTNDVYAVVGHWVKKLRKGGTILIGGTDPNEVANALVTGQINIIEFNKLIHGEQTSVWTYKYGCATIKDVCAMLKSLGLKILRTRTNNFEMFVEAVRD